MALLGASVLTVVAFGTVKAQAQRTEDATVLRTHGLTIAMGGHPVGTLIGRDLKTPAGFVFERTQDLSIQRGSTTLNIHVESRSEVDANLRPIRGRFVKEDAGGALVMTSTAVGDTLKVEVTQSGSTVKKDIPLTQGLTYYAALEHELRENLRDGFALARPIFVEEMTGVFEMKASVKRSDPAGVGAAFVATISMPSLETVEHYDSSGRVLRSETPAVNSLAYPLGAPAPKGIKNGPADMLAATTWPIEPLEGTPQSIRYRVWTKDARKFAVPEDSRQRVVNRTDAFVEILVKGERASHGGMTSKDRKRFLSETQFEAIYDADLVKTAQRVTAGAKGTHEKIARLTAFVHDHVKTHDLDRTYSPAVTTLKAQKGDCTEKSVLLSALLKTEGIPTRLVEGVVISGDLIGYHEWVEAFVDGEGFFPADPTFGEFPATVERLKLVQATSDPEDILSFGLSASRIMRPGVKIEVVETH